MKVVAITGKRTCEIVERPDPRIKGDFVKIAIRAAPMCTEVREYRDGTTSDSLGHEAAGEVVEIAQPGSVAVGDRVVVMPQYGCGKCTLCLSGEHVHCQHPVDPYRFCESQTGRATYAQFCIKPDWLLVPIPDDVSYDHASMACCGLGPTFNAMQQMGVNALDTVLISGLGAVGLGAVVNARCRGARVIALESNEYRASLAKSLGVEAVIDPQDERGLERILALTAGCGADKSVETSSAETAAGFPGSSHKTQGSGGIGRLGRADLGQGYRRQGADCIRCLALEPRPGRGSHVQDDSPVGAMLDKVITHVFAMRDVEKAWELQLTGKCGKIILHPWE